MITGRDRFFDLLVLLLGAGLATSLTALATYVTRYSRFDSLMGEIDASLYSRITQMAPAAKAALVVGALLIAVSIGGLSFRRRRPAAAM